MMLWLYNDFTEILLLLMQIPVVLFQQWLEELLLPWEWPCLTRTPSYNSLTCRLQSSVWAVRLSTVLILFLGPSWIKAPTLTLSPKPKPLNPFKTAINPKPPSRRYRGKSAMPFWELPSMVASEASSKTRPQTLKLVIYGSFRKLGVSYFGVLIIRILLYRVLY